LKPGFYGKLPHLGDFVSRRLPRQFIDPWDRWLQSGILASREQLGDNWLDIYLVSPIWRFVLSPGLCGDTAWAGILMPSVDKVGRYFPLTLASSIALPGALPHLFAPDNPWFEKMEELALSGLDHDFDLERFDAKLQALQLPDSFPVSRESGEEDASREAESKFALHVGVDSLRDSGGAFAGLTESLLSEFLPRHSFWCTAGSEMVHPAILVFDGLPPCDTLVALMTGDWKRRGWAMGSARDDFAYPSDDAEEGLTIPRLKFVRRETENAPFGDWRWVSHGISAVGNRRRINEDSFVERSDIGLWAVADGMGGHEAGDMASQAIATALSRIGPDERLEEFAGRVEACLKQVNAELFEWGQTHRDGKIVGSTVIALLARGNRCMALWAGDSRLYRLRGGALEQLSRDHSLLEDLSRKGVLTPSQARESLSGANVITRAVGADMALNLETVAFEAQDGDFFLLCSDGLDKEVSQEHIQALLASDDVTENADILIKEALRRGGRDNVTVVVVCASVGSRAKTE
jgi:type VI secretion system protein ImpM